VVNTQHNWVKTENCYLRKNTFDNVNNYFQHNLKQGVQVHAKFPRRRL